MLILSQKGLRALHLLDVVIALREGDGFLPLLITFYGGHGFRCVQGRFAGFRMGLRPCHKISVPSLSWTGFCETLSLEGESC